jgi:hypothetical protein
MGCTSGHLLCRKCVAVYRKRREGQLLWDKDRIAYCVQAIGRIPADAKDPIVTVFGLLNDPKAGDRAHLNGSAVVAILVRDDARPLTRARSLVCQPGRCRDVGGT